MSDAIIRAAHERLEVARNEVANLEAFVATYHDLERATKALGNGSSVAVSTATGRVFRGPVTHQVTNVADTGRLADTERGAGEIIRKHGRPVPTQSLLQELTGMGIEVGGKDPSSTLSARLSRAPSLEFQRGLGWALKSAAAQEDEAADPDLEKKVSAASDNPNDAERRGEVEHHNMT